MGGFSVISLEPGLIPLDIVSTVLASGIGMTHVEAVRRARRSERIVADGLSRDEAEIVFEALSRFHVNVLVVPPDGQIAMGVPAVTHNADCEPDAFCYYPDVSSEYRMLSWASIFFAGHGIITGRSDYPVNKAPLDIACINPPAYLRLNAKGLNYDYLSDRRRTSSGENFRLFIGDLAKYVKDAYFAKDLADLVATGRYKPPRFSSLQDFSDYIRWNLLVIVMGADIPHGPRRMGTEDL